MLRVTTELVPWGVDEYANTLGELYIGNDGTGTNERGNYDVYTRDPRGQQRDDRSQREGWIGRVENFPREDFPREEGHARLVFLAMKLLNTLHECVLPDDVRLLPGGWIT